MNTKTLRVLLVEDCPDDAELLLEELKLANYNPQAKRVEEPHQMQEALDSYEWDIIISDYSLPRFSAPEALRLLKENKIDLPFIIISGVIGEEAAVEVMKAGAHDYIKKGNSARLIPAIERELREARIRRERKAAEEALRKSEARLAEAQRIAGLGNWDWQMESDVLYLSDELYHIFGIIPHEFDFTFQALLERVHPDDQSIFRQAIEDALYRKKAYHTEYRILRPDGDVRYVQAQAKVFFDQQGKPIRLFGIIQDITERKRNEEERKILEEQLRNTVLDSIIALDKDLNIVNMNHAASRLFNVDVEEVIGHSFTSLCTPGRENIASTVKKSLDSHTEVHEHQLTGTLNDRNWTYIIGLTPLIENGKEETVLIIRDITRLRQLETEVTSKFSFNNIIGKSPSMLKIFDLVRHLADTKTTVLIQGASGTGKELIAAALHHTGTRKNEPFIKVNCAALPENLLESELFGHVRGAFTGAERDKVGRFELAQNGTIFLDEIGDISPDLQIRLLRVLQEREIERVGSTKTTKINVRVVTATNRDLSELVAQGRFREDLFYRLNVVKIQIPPLKDRREDIPLLVRHFFNKFQDRIDRHIKGIDPEAMEILLNYDWPGNVRQLENVIEHAVVLSRENMIYPENLPIEILEPTQLELESAPAISTPQSTSTENEAQQLKNILESVNWNRSEAARILNVNRITIWRKIKKFGLFPSANQNL